MTPKEFPGHLSALQFDLLRAFREPAFFLTGGGALIGFYGHERITRDLDLVLETVPAASEPIELSSYNISIDTLEELAVNKICALVGRAEPRDLIDLHFLHTKGLDLDNTIAQAKQKDGGVGTDTLLLALQGISPKELDEKTTMFLSTLLKKLKLDLLPPE